MQLIHYLGQAMRDAAATAAEAQRFRPVGVTTRFGQSQFGFDPTTGQIKVAYYGYGALATKVGAGAYRWMVA